MARWSLESRGPPLLTPVHLQLFSENPVHRNLIVQGQIIHVTKRSFTLGKDPPGVGPSFLNAFKTWSDLRCPACDLMGSYGNPGCPSCCPANFPTGKKAQCPGPGNKGLVGAPVWLGFTFYPWRGVQDTLLGTESRTRAQTCLVTLSGLSHSHSAGGNPGHGDSPLLEFPSVSN